MRIQGIFILLPVLMSCSQPQEPFPLLEGPYLGQSPPGLSPHVFAPGIVSTDANELNSVFSPDGREFFFTKQLQGGEYAMMFTRQEGDRWSEPAVARFSGEHPDVDMCYSLDGDTLFFCSTRPLTKGGDRVEGYQIWMVSRSSSGWGEPQNLGSRVNSGERQIYPSVTLDGTLYFQARRPSGYGESDLYKSRYENGVYQEPENLGDVINTEHNEGDVLIAPDESFLVVSSRRPDGYGEGDLYVSFRRDDGIWTEPQNIERRPGMLLHWLKPNVVEMSEVFRRSSRLRPTRA
jgi:hypothetical protein